MRLATSRFRPLPNLILIGAIRGGSTSVFDALVEGGAVAPKRKEVHYFDRSLERGLNWYRSWYPLGHRARPVIDATPSLLGLGPSVAATLRSELPDTKLIAVLRHPVDRAFSHYDWRRSRGHEPELDPFAAFQQDAARRRGPDVSRLNAYLLHSAYDVALDAWRDEFPDDQLLILISERLFAGDPDELELLSRFAGVEISSIPRRNTREMGESSTDQNREEAREFLGQQLESAISYINEYRGADVGWN